jgi:hypothetical protein
MKLSLLLCFVLVGCSITRNQAPMTQGQPLGTVVVVAVPGNGGQVAGGGSYPARSRIQISASPNGGWLFVQWNDGNTSASRIVVVPNPNNTITYTATFQQQAVTTTPITVGWDKVTGAASYRVYQGRASHSYTNYTTTTSSSLQIQVWPGITYVATTSIGTTGLESTNYSNEITYTY